MTPIRYSKEGERTKFHYKFSDLRQFVYYALNEGNAGSLLIAREGKKDIYKVSGTIENPQRNTKTVRDLYTMTVVHNEIFDGKRKTDDELLIPPNYKFLESHKMVFIDYEEEDGTITPVKEVK